MKLSSRHQGKLDASTCALAVGFEHAQVYVSQPSEQRYNIGSMGVPPMRRTVLATILSLLVVLPAIAEDQQKAVKQLNRITALASDVTGRRVVSMSVADMLQSKRADLVRERRVMGVNYGGIFLVHQLTAAGVALPDITSRLRSGKNILQVAEEFHADWKQVLNNAKKLNGKIERNLYDYFVDPKEAKDREADERYNVFVDIAKGDATIGDDDLDSARDVYMRLRGIAAQRAGQHGATLDTQDEKTVWRDHTSDRDLTPPQKGNNAKVSPM